MRDSNVPVLGSARAQSASNPIFGFVRDASGALWRVMMRDSQSRTCTPDNGRMPNTRTVNVPSSGPGCQIIGIGILWVIDLLELSKSV